MAKSDLRLSIELVILMMLLCPFIALIGYMNETTYAYTFSFGQGIGFSIYTRNYDELPEVVKKYVVIHEGVHLREGTVDTHSNEDEIKAYSEEIAAIDRDLQEIMKRYKENPDSRLVDDYLNLLRFKAESQEMMETYRK